MAQTDVRTFRVHALEIDNHHAHTIQESGYEAAAVAYLEHYLHDATQGDDVSVIVQEVQSGHFQCFKIDLRTGEPTTCP